MYVYVLLYYINIIKCLEKLAVSHVTYPSFKNLCQYATYPTGVVEISIHAKWAFCIKRHLHSCCVIMKIFINVAKIIIRKSKLNLFEYYTCLVMVT